MFYSLAKFVAQVLVTGAGAYAMAYGLGGASEALAEAGKAWSDGSSESTSLRAANS